MGVFRPKAPQNVAAIQWVGSDYNCSQIKALVKETGCTVSVDGTNPNILLFIGPSEPSIRAVLVSSWIVKRRSGVNPTGFDVDIMHDREFNLQYEDIT